MQCETCLLFQHVILGEINMEANESLIANSRQEKSGTRKSRSTGEDRVEDQKIETDLGGGDSAMDTTMR